MNSERHISPLAVLFWLIATGSIVVLWRFMPNSWTQIGLLILLGIIIFSTINRQADLPVLSTIFLALAVVHYFQATHPAWPLAGALLAIVLVPALGLAGEKLDRRDDLPDSHLVVGNWLILGLITAQAVSIFSYWPVSFFNRSLLTGTFFYTFWQMIIIQKTGETRRLITHFAFVTLTVIVIVGILIWVNFPQLISL